MLTYFYLFIYLVSGNGKLSDEGAYQGGNKIKYVEYVLQFYFLICFSLFLSWPWKLFSF